MCFLCVRHLPIYASHDAILPLFYVVAPVIIIFSSVQFSCSVMSNSLQPLGMQHARLFCPSPTPGACSNSCPSNQWCHPTISSSVIPFSSCLQSCPASESFPMVWSPYCPRDSQESSTPQFKSINSSALSFIFFFFNWRLITLQYCSGFCHTLTWISHGVTHIPHPDPPSHLPLHPIPLCLPSAPGPSTCLMHPAWAGELFHYR